jgi:mannose-6-phosphate isomerase-like protein (cupin superfamily)
MRRAVSRRRLPAYPSNRRRDEGTRYVVLGGSGVLEIESETVALKEGEAIFVPAGAEHRFVGYEQLSVLVIFSKPERTA